MEIEFSLDQISQVADKIIAQNPQKIILFNGEMGVGKTTFTKAFCQHFGVSTTTSSPTFSLVNEYFYANTEGVQKVIHHLDLYRLNTLAEAMDIGIEDYLYDDSYCLIEWPQLIEPIFPDDVLKISIELIENSMRKIVVL